MKKSCNKFQTFESSQFSRVKFDSVLFVIIITKFQRKWQRKKNSTSSFNLQDHDTFNHEKISLIKFVRVFTILTNKIVRPEYSNFHKITKRKKKQYVESSYFEIVANEKYFSTIFTTTIRTFEEKSVSSFPPTACIKKTSFGRNSKRTVNSESRGASSLATNPSYLSLCDSLSRNCATRNI